MHWTLDTSYPLLDLRTSETSAVNNSNGSSQEKAASLEDLFNRNFALVTARMVMFLSPGEIIV
jgi:hypothetical protein